MINFYAGYSDPDYRTPLDKNVQTGHANTYRFYKYLRLRGSSMVEHYAKAIPPLLPETDINVVVVVPTVAFRDSLRTFHPDWIIVTSAKFMHTSFVPIKHSVLFTAGLRDLHLVIEKAELHYPDIFCGIDNIKSVLSTHYRVKTGKHGAAYNTYLRQLNER